MLRPRAGSTRPATAARAGHHRDVWLAVAVVLVALLVAARIFVVEPMRIESHSMAPTLKAGDQVLVDKHAYRGSAAPERGDLAVFEDPRSGEVMLKRVVAVGGDTVGIEDGSLVVNGRRPVEPYADPNAIDSVYFGPVDVRPGTFFVLGDNRANSLDSRRFGSVPKSAFIGRPRARVWPPGRWAAAR